ncbi:MAG: hypothetical protein KC549_17285, partial [Myxococcales bacterium]|nr:hypothetical protein [Myxococcales bacterium]
MSLALQVKGAAHEDVAIDRRERAAGEPGEGIEDAFATADDLGIDRAWTCQNTLDAASRQPTDGGPLQEGIRRQGIPPNRLSRHVDGRVDG